MVGGVELFFDQAVVRTRVPLHLEPFVWTLNPLNLVAT